MEIFNTLRKKARIECTCGKRDIVTGLFHDTDCPYLKTFIEAYPEPFEPNDEQINVNGGK